MNIANNQVDKKDIDERSCEYRNRLIEKTYEEVFTKC